MSTSKRERALKKTVAKFQSDLNKEGLPAGIFLAMPSSSSIHDIVTGRNTALFRRALCHVWGLEKDALSNKFWLHVLSLVWSELSTEKPGKTLESVKKFVSSATDFKQVLTFVTARAVELIKDDGENAVTNSTQNEDVDAVTDSEQNQDSDAEQNQRSDAEQNQRSDAEQNQESDAEQNQESDADDNNSNVGLTNRVVQSTTHTSVSTNSMAKRIQQAAAMEKRKRRKRKKRRKK